MRRWLVLSLAGLVPLMRTEASISAPKSDAPISLGGSFPSPIFGSTGIGSSRGLPSAIIPAGMLGTATSLGAAGLQALQGALPIPIASAAAAPTRTIPIPVPISLPRRRPQLVIFSARGAGGAGGAGDGADKSEESSSSSEESDENDGGNAGGGSGGGLSPADLDMLKMLIDSSLKANAAKAAAAAPPPPPPPPPRGGNGGRGGKRKGKGKQQKQNIYVNVFLTKEEKKPKESPAPPPPQPPPPPPPRPIPVPVPYPVHVQSYPQVRYQPVPVLVQPRHSGIRMEHLEHHLGGGGADLGQLIHGSDVGGLILRRYW